MKEFILNLKRSEKPAYRFLRGLVKMIIRPRAPRVPGLLRPLFRLFYEMHFGVITITRSLINVAYRHPLFQGRCVKVGSNVCIDNLPYVQGPVEIEIGNNVWLGGNITILSSFSGQQPRLIVKDYAEMGWNVQINVSKEVVIEEHARISYDCRISDSDGHPRQADLRAQNRPPHPRDMRPVLVGRHAWIGNGSHILKGVKIGEGAVVGANSVVISDIPPYSLAMGNPAEVLIRNYGRPSNQSSATA